MCSNYRKELGICNSKLHVISGFDALSCALIYSDVLSCAGITLSVQVFKHMPRYGHLESCP